MRHPSAIRAASDQSGMTAIAVNIIAACWSCHTVLAGRSCGETVLMHYTGLVEQTPAFKSAAEKNRETAWDDQYMRLALRFDTGAARYRWLTTSLFVAKGRLPGTGSIEYAVYRVT
jgi:hypothetical protein